MIKKEIRKDLPEKFYKYQEGTGFPSLAYTVGQLKEVLKEIPDDIEIRQNGEKGVHIVVYNVGYDNTHLSFEENEYFDEEEDEEYDPEDKP